MEQSIPDQHDCGGRGMPAPTETVEVWRAPAIGGPGCWDGRRVKDRVISATSIKSHFTVEGSPEMFTREEYGRTWRWPAGDR